MHHDSMSVNFVRFGHTFPLPHNATCFLEPESLGVKLTNDGLIEIVYQCRKQKEYGVLCHERLGEPVPAESVVHIIEYTLFAPTLVVKFDDVSC